MLTKAEAENRVALGAEHLDRIFPGWADHVNVNTLDLGCDCRCILGQLDGSYNKAIRKREIIPRPWWVPYNGDQQAEAMGFDGPMFKLAAERDRDWKFLQDAWVEQIALRRCRVEDPPSVDAVREETDQPVMATRVA